MVAHSASQGGGFTPVELPRVAVAADGTVATVLESSRVTILEIPSGVAFAEIGVDPEALASEVAWLGTPPRLLVLSRYAAHSTAHLLDPYGPRTIAEIRLETPMRLHATVGNAALVVGALGAAVLVGSESHLLAYQFPTRAVPVAAGAAANQFVVALSSSIEEWDPQSRMPKRRLRLPRTAAITAVGGSERIVWMTTQQEPARIDVIPLINRGQPKAHDLPEPIASIAGQPRSDLVACIGAETGRLYVVDLDGRARLRTFDPEGLDRIDAIGLVVGRMVGVLAAQAQRPIAVVPLDGRDMEGEAGGTEPAAPTLFGRVQPVSARPTSEPDREDAIVTEPARAEPPSGPSVGPSVGPSAQPAARPVATLAATMDRVRSNRPTAPPASAAGPPSSPSPSPSPSSGRPSPSPRLGGSAPSMATRLATPSPSAAAPSPPSRLGGSLPSMAARLATPSPSATGPSPRLGGSLPSSAARPSPAAAAAAAAAAASATAAPATVFRVPSQAASSRSLATAAEASRPAASASGRFSAWRDLARQNQPLADPAGSASRAAGSTAARDDWQSWRDEIVTWSCAIISGATDLDVPAAAAIDVLIARFELAPALHPVLALLYGAHLCGERGAAPADIARLLDRQWDEALGRGELAGRGVAEYASSRVALSPLVLRLLDELPPLTGTVVGEPGEVSLLGPCVVVAGDEPLTAVAERCLAHVNGAILAAHGDPDRAMLLFEARARGAAPMLRAAITAPPSDAAIFVIGDAELADRLGLPRLA